MVPLRTHRDSLTLKSRLLRVCFQHYLCLNLIVELGHRVLNVLLIEVEDLLVGVLLKVLRLWSSPLLDEAGRIVTDLFDHLNLLLAVNTPLIHVV